ncbi:hypothetical protein D3C81_817740 [compost metagenome]
MFRCRLTAPAVARGIAVFANMRFDRANWATERRHTRHKGTHDALTHSRVVFGGLVLRLTPTNR